mgnify:CR=1 FL=1
MVGHPSPHGRLMELDRLAITKTYTGTMGITYRTRVVVTTGVDKIDATSTERTV